MSFIPYSTDDGRVPAWEYRPCGAIQPKVGLALAYDSGKLAVATGKPEYICMRHEEAEVASGTVIPVIAVADSITFLTENTASLEAVNEGDAVTISSDGMAVTATTESGVATILRKSGDAVGSDVLVKFK
ncbi:MAG: hypothetical protein ACI4PP_03030 [Clostridia bacterium]